VSATMLQRVVVRVLFDPDFCQRVYTDPATALHDVDLTAEERQWLVTPDPRAYGVDVHRRSRALTGLLEEYPVAGALAVRCPQGVQRLYGFFAAAVFHQCVQQRGSMAGAFGVYLGSQAFADQPAIACLAAVERSIVRVRRVLVLAEDQARALAADSRLRLAPWVALLSVPARTLSCYSELRHHLLQHGASLLEAVLDPAYHLPAAPPLNATETVFVLVVNVPGEAGPSLEPTSQELGALLAAAQEGIACQDLCAVAVNLGAEPHEALDIILGLLTERLLIRCQ
jgi:hypothetical protein